MLSLLPAIFCPVLSSPIHEYCWLTKACIDMNQTLFCVNSYEDVTIFYCVFFCFWIYFCTTSNKKACFFQRSNYKPLEKAEQWNSNIAMVTDLELNRESKSDTVFYSTSKRCWKSAPNVSYIYLHTILHYCLCFGWARVNFRSSSWYSAVLWFSMWIMLIMHWCSRRC